MLCTGQLGPANAAIGICEIDASRRGSVNKLIDVLLLVIRFGAGLSELEQHPAAFNCVAVEGRRDGRVVTLVDRLREHADPCVAESGRHRTPTASGYNAGMHSRSLERFAFGRAPVRRKQIAAI